MNQDQIKSIVLFGAAGMVGSNIMDLAPANFIVHAPKRAELDLLNAQEVSNYLIKNKPDLIINSAGKVGGIQANMAFPYSFFTENLLINQNIILGAKNAGVRKMLNLGSSCMYPKSAINPLKEEMLLSGTLEPTNEGYALAKIVAQRMQQYLMEESTDWQYKTLIPCNLYGKYDKFDPLFSHMIPGVIDRLHKAKNEQVPSVAIWGDGTVRREFMYAEDLALMIWEIVAQFDNTPDVMNLGLGEDYSILEYYKIIAKVVGFEGEFTFDTSKPTGMKQKLVDNSLQQKMGLKAKHSLEEGISKTYQFYLNHF
jgi:GDP-L-fucose synthase